MASRSSAASPRAPSPAMTSDHPSKMRSIPTNVPITQTADTGHSAAIIVPSATVTMPQATAQPRPGNRTESAVAMRKTPPTMKNAAMRRVSESVPAAGFATIRPPTTKRQHPAEQMARESAPPADAPRVDRLEDAGDDENPPEN